MRPLGSLLEHLESHVKASGSVLGAFGSLLGRLWSVLGASWTALRASWEPLGPSWERLGSILEACAGILRGISETFWKFCGNLGRQHGKNMQIELSCRRELNPERLTGTKKYLQIDENVILEGLLAS